MCNCWHVLCVLHAGSRLCHMEPFSCFMHSIQSHKSCSLCSLVRLAALAWYGFNILQEQRCFSAWVLHVLVRSDGFTPHTITYPKHMLKNNTCLKTPLFSLALFSLACVNCSLQFMLCDFLRMCYV